MVIISVGWLTGCDGVDLNVGWTSWCRGKAVEGKRESDMDAAVTTSSSSAISGLYWWWLSCTWVEGLVEYRKYVARAYERDWKRQDKGSRFWQWSG